MSEQPKFEDLIRPSTAATLLEYDFAVVTYYRRKGRFCKEYMIDGQAFFLRDEVLKWKPNTLKAGRPKQ